MEPLTPTQGTAAAGSDTLRQTDEQRAASRTLSLQSLETPGVSPGYEIIRKLGTGSFGAVWLAREVKTGKQVAIKFYTHRRGLDWSLLTREVEKLAVLYTSRDIVGLLDVGWDHDPPYFVMEFLEHGSLQARLQAGRLPVETSVRIATSIARALVHAHGSGILHCDLKPANILLDKTDEPRLGDFGQSRLTTEQSPALGTMYYMAPEQADLNAVPDARWDVYALGALMYEMLTGSPPYRTDDAERILSRAGGLEERLVAYRQVISRSPPPSAHRDVKGVDKRLAEIVDCCLKANPHERFPNAQVVLDRLEQRTAARSRRPLIAVGFLGPVLFLLTMFSIAKFTVDNANVAAEENLVDRALAGDSVSALILADSIQRDLAARQERVQTLARTAAARTAAMLLDKHPELAVPEGATPEEIEHLADLRRTLVLGLMENEAVPDKQPEDGSEPDPFPPAYAELVGEIKANETRLSDVGRTANTGWFIVGNQGRQVFRYPPRKSDGKPHDTIGESFHWRKYYTAEAEDRPKSTSFEKVSPRTEPGVSPHFRSEATGQYMVAIAAPIWDEPHETWLKGGQVGDDPGRVIGVMASVIHIADLLDQWEHKIRDLVKEEEEEDPNDRFLALATRSPEEGGDEFLLLDHPWLTKENLDRVAPSDDENVRNDQLDAFMAQLQLTTPEPAILARLFDSEPERDYREKRYSDPLKDQSSKEFGGQWLAAFARVGLTDWIAIVQERRETAVEPVQKVNAVFYQAGIIAIIVFSVLLAILWYFLNRASSTK
jgi:serine/threonine protein kinase